jgi:hypothetical protein
VGTTKGKTGTVRSVVFRPEQEARKDKLLAETGLNWNQFARLCVEALTPDDVRQLQQRLK